MNKIRVFIIDDSAVVRQTLKDVLDGDPEIEVIGVAPDPLFALQKLVGDWPDVFITDLEMPRMDGIAFLKKIMAERPSPVVVCSSMAEEGSQNAMLALELGAVEIVQKPKMGTKQFIEESRVRLCDVVKAANMAKIGPPRAQRGPRRETAPLPVQPKFTADVILPRATNVILETTEKVIAVGASTGGTEAIKDFLEALPPDAPGIVIVQHMPENFTRAFAQRLDGLCRVSVKEAEDNDTVLRGRALIAPGNRHMLLKRAGARYYVEVREGPLVSRHRPSVDVLFRSAARYAGKNVIGVIMTGMGDDGSRGMLEMHEAGAYNIAQDEASCVVYGMPNEAVKRGGVDVILPLGEIAAEVIRKGQL